MKKTSVLILVILFITAGTIIGIFARLRKPPELTITIDHAKIDILKLQEIPDDNKYLFKPAFEKETAIKINHVEVGKKVTLDFGNSPPDKITIQEIFLMTNGEMLYTENLIKDITFTQEKNKYFFTIEKSIVSQLSSVYFKGKTDLRGYKITALTGKDKRVYICVIRTDA